jgi:ubiquinone/menaquinone biosynthesis C-methylase UbiE
MTEALRRAMNPTAAEIAALPISGHAEVARDLLAGKGDSVLDVGCGAGSFTWLVAPFFKRVAGLDPNAARIEEAQAAAKTKGLEIDFRVGEAERMPFADASFDVVVFSNSLHHIPGMDAALAEAARVVKPGGIVYAMEPVPAGTFFEATRLVNDETEIRSEAWRSLHRAAGMKPEIERLYRARRGFTSIDEWRDGQIGHDPQRGVLFEQHKDEISRRFHAAAEREGGKLMFTTVSRVNLLRRGA